MRDGRPAHQRALAGLAGVSGAEWSFAWPAMGIAFASCAAVNAVLVRAPVASVRVAPPGPGSTDDAAGTDWSVGGDATAATSAWPPITGVTALDRPLSHAARSAAHATRQLKAMWVFMR